MDTFTYDDLLDPQIWGMLLQSQEPTFKAKLNPILIKDIPIGILYRSKKYPDTDVYLIGVIYPDKDAFPRPFGSIKITGTLLPGLTNVTFKLFSDQLPYSNYIDTYHLLRGIKHKEGTTWTRPGFTATEKNGTKSEISAMDVSFTKSRIDAAYAAYNKYPQDLGSIFRQTPLGNAGSGPFSKIAAFLGKDPSTAASIFNSNTVSLEERKRLAARRRISTNKNGNPIVDPLGAGVRVYHENGKLGRNPPINSSTETKTTWNKPLFTNKSLQLFPKERVTRKVIFTNKSLQLFPEERVTRNVIFNGGKRKYKRRSFKRGKRTRNAKRN
jgi:hypothetical protein